MKPYIFFFILEVICYFYQAENALVLSRKQIQQHFSALYTFWIGIHCLILLLYTHSVWLYTALKYYSIPKECAEVQVKIWLLLSKKFMQFLSNPQKLDFWFIPFSKLTIHLNIKYLLKYRSYFLKTKIF